MIFQTSSLLLCKPLATLASSVLGELPDTSLRSQSSTRLVCRRTILLGGASLVSLRMSATNRAIAKDALDHEYFMRLAIAAGKKSPRYPFGAVIVDMTTKQVVAEGFNLTATKNPTWHGEMAAINNCPEVASGFKWTNVCIYTTAEPCPMCTAAIIWTGMPLVVYGTQIPTLKAQGIRQIDLRSSQVIATADNKPRLIGRVLEKDCDQLFIDARKIRNAE